MATDFPAELEQFIAQHIESLAQLEALLQVRRAPERAWTCQDLSQHLYMSPEVCSTIVADLERRGFVERLADDSQSFRYRVADPAVDQLVHQLEILYQERRVAVITQIYSKPVKKVQTFADAFRFRQES